MNYYEIYRTVYSATFCHSKANGFVNRNLVIRLHMCITWCKSELITFITYNLIKC